MKSNNFVTMAMAAVTLLGAGGALSAAQLGDRIESSAKKSYVFVTFLKDDAITIKATNEGAVTLTGTITEWSHRSLAEETVLGLPGVVSVDNKLDMSGNKPEENSDAWIGVKVKTMLLFHKNVSGFKTDVEVKDGVVTLRGPASSDAQKDLTGEYVKDIDGVKSVKNDMTVEKTEKSTMEKVGGYIDDASITAQVKLALLFHRSTSALTTKVETKNGVVTVRGIAKNDAEKELVGKLVTDIKGVKSIKNKITVG
ncbi:MAG TPA: BON domain-containing protein [Chitinivibrionales bacterium]